MQRKTLFRVWLVLNLLAAAVVWLWMPSPERWLCLGFTAASTAIFALVTWLIWRRFARYVRRLEDYSAALPANTVDLPEDLPSELTMLASALERTAQHVRSVIDRGNLELARRETVLAGMAEGVLAVDQDLRVTFYNDAFAEAFQTRRTVPEGRQFLEVVREPDLRQILDQVVTTGARVRRRLHLLAAGGRWFEIHALPLGDVAVAGAIMVLHDVTDIQRQEQAQKDFVANVSHELRTPLAAIRGYAETLLDGALEDASINRKFIEVIQAHAIRLNNIASDLLALSELDAHTPPIPPSPLPVPELIESAIHTVQGAAANRNIRLQVAGDLNTVVMGNRVRLEQILVNLLDNAVKFNRPSGSVTITCHPGPEMVEISVRDTGIGIPSEDLKRIFDRFYRVDKARSRQAGGTGLGLSIVKEAIERMGGSVSVASHFGQGTCFTLQIPAAPSHVGSSAS